MHMFVYIYIYIERERDKEREREIGFAMEDEGACKDLATVHFNAGIKERNI